MHIIDYQHITVSDLNELDNTTLVYDGCLCNSQFKGCRDINDSDKLYGFITYKSTYDRWKSSFLLGEYIEDILPVELRLLEDYIKIHPERTFFINPLGFFVDCGRVFFHCIRPRLPEILYDYDNVYLLWNNIPQGDELMKNSSIACTMKIRDYNFNYLPYKYLAKVGNEVDINRLNNKHIPIDLPTGVYVKE